MEFLFPVYTVIKCKNSTIKKHVCTQAYREANLQSSRESNFKRSSSFLRASPSTLLSTPSSSQSQLFHGLVQILHPMSTAIPEHSEVGAMTEANPAVSETETSDTGYYGCSDRGKCRIIID